MAFDRHTVYGGALVAVIALASIAGIAITGGPGEARRQKEDQARLQAVSEAALALACYQQAKGPIPEDLSIVEAELARADSEVHRRSSCSRAELARDPVTGQPFRLRREDGRVTHICADFATGSDGDGRRAFFAGHSSVVVPNLDEARNAPGEHCFGLNLEADLD